MKTTLILLSFLITITQALALEVIDFKLNSIEENAFNLSWEFNVNSEDYEVILQKSITGSDFENIMLDSNQKSYRDWDVKRNLQYYYRLKIIDKNGNQHYSEILNASLKTSSSFLDASIFPNPTEKNLNLQIVAKSAGTIEYQIIDTSGRPIHQFNHTLDVGTNDFQIEIETLPPNQYFLQLEFYGEVILRPFTKI